MNESVYKIIELTGTSKTNIEGAIQNAISKASETVREMKWFEVIETRGQIEKDRVAFWQVTIKVGFNVEGKQGEKPQLAAAKKTEVAQKGEEKKGGYPKYRCKVCGYIYDPAKGDPSQEIKPGTAFKELPDSWQCPECGVNKEQFEKIS